VVARTDEIYEAVRIGAGMGDDGALKPKRMQRALDTIDMYAHFCRATGLRPDDVQAVATSAIRDAANRAEFLSRAREVSGLDVRVLSREEEARYGYLAAVNSTTLEHGAVLDLGGGSLQLVRVDRRLAQESGSWRLGTVRMTERFLPDDVRRGSSSRPCARTWPRSSPPRRGWPRRASGSWRSAAPSATWRPPPSTTPGCRRWACRGSC
jgi:exopolyphosphatase/guanosine-5'-triphosphate,3'-diphosphate pyrophosphatase